MDEEQSPRVEHLPEDAEPGTSVARPPWWRSRRALAAGVAGLAALALGGALFAADRAQDRGDDADARPTAADEDRPETRDEDALDALEGEGDAGSGDTHLATPQRDPDRDVVAGAPDSAPDAGAASMPNLDISPAAFRDRWNVAVGELGRGYQLDELDIDDLDFGDQPAGEAREYPVEQTIEGPGLIQVRIRPDGLVSSVVIDGEPSGAEQDDYFATFAAAVAAVTDLGVQEAVEMLASDLGLDGTADPASHVGGTQVGEVVVQVEAASGRWSFYVGGPWTS